MRRYGFTIAQDSATIGVWWGWIFSRSGRASVATYGFPAVRSASHALFSLFFPDSCRICHQHLYEVTRIPVCRACLEAPQPLEAEFFCTSCRTPFVNRFPLDQEGRCGLCRGGLRAFDAAYSFGAYAAELRDLVHLLKYAKIRTLSKPLGKLLLRALPRDEAFDVIVPVPLHWRRRIGRGFNQSQVLAREIARLTGLPAVSALRRVKATAVQAGLTNTARRRNVARAFTCSRERAVAGKRILLIDDVLTTGATAAACALALKRAGAARVAVLTVARADRRLNSMLRGES
jgi:ComF family protein